jgi:hypothetical protein
VCTIKGLVTYYVLFFIDIASRSVQIPPFLKGMVVFCRGLEVIRLPVRAPDLSRAGREEVSPLRVL